MKNNRGGCLVCLDGHIGTGCKENNTPMLRVQSHYR